MIGKVVKPAMVSLLPGGRFCPERRGAVRAARCDPRTAAAQPAVGPGAGLAHVSHILVWLEEGASVTYVHEYASPTEQGQTMHAGIVELHVGAGATCALSSCSRGARMCGTSPTSAPK
jgi:hypothetical protein